MKKLIMVLSIMVLAVMVYADPNDPNIIDPNKVIVPDANDPNVIDPNIIDPNDPNAEPTVTYQKLDDTHIKSTYRVIVKKTELERRKISLESQVAFFRNQLELQQAKLDDVISQLNLLSANDPNIIDPNGPNDPKKPKDPNE